MRVALSFCMVALLGLTSGCGPGQETRSPPGPLFVGKLEGGAFWKNPLSSTVGNEGGDHPKGSRVEVYDQFIVVTTPDGLSYVHPHGYYSGLTIKRD